MAKEQLTLSYKDVSLRTVERDGQTYIRSTDISKALGYATDYAVGEIYSRYKDEFTEDMSLTLKLRGRGNYKHTVRYFNRRGAWLIAIFARTKQSKDFRKWVLDVLEEKTLNPRIEVREQRTEKVITLEQYEIIFGASQRLIKEIEQRCEALAAINNDKQASTWLRDKLLEEMKAKIHVLETGLMEKKYPGLWKNMPVHQIVKQFEEEEKAFIGEQKLLR